MADRVSESLEQRVRSNKATPEEIEKYMKRDLKNLPGYRVYQEESNFTRQWSCPDCGGPIPCSIDCPQCGHSRPRANADPDQEGYIGSLRRKAGYRPPG